MKNKETLEDYVLDSDEHNNLKSDDGTYLNFHRQSELLLKGAKLGSEWQQKQEQNNENSWFNEYQEVENYIIKSIGNKFLEATPDKYKTASEATIALLENNWKQEQNKKMYNEEEVLKILYDWSMYKIEFELGNLSADELVNELNGILPYDEWFEHFKKK